jgi:hypothetical protein
MSLTCGAVAAPQEQRDDPAMDFARLVVVAAFTDVGGGQDVKDAIGRVALRIATRAAAAASSTDR